MADEQQQASHTRVQRRPLALVPTVLLLGCAAPLVLLGLASALLLVIEQLANDRPIDEAFVGRTKVGTPLTLREMQGSQFNNMGGINEIVTGDFDGDGDQELAIASYGSSSVLLSELDGSSAGSIALSSTGFSRLICAWDCDDDGRDELAIENGQVEIHGLRGSVASFTGYSTGGIPTMHFNGALNLAADADGDGRDELWLMSSSSQDIHAIDIGGKVIHNFGQQFGSDSSLCDLDLDGKHELLLLDYSGQVTACDMTGSRTIGSGPAGSRGFACLDADNDGKPDVVFGDMGYLDSTGSFIRFKETGGTRHSRLMMTCMLPMDLDNDGQAEIVSTGWVSGGLLGWSGGDNVLRSYDPARQVLELEQATNVYGEPIAVHAGGRDYLLFNNHDKLLIYP